MPRLKVDEPPQMGKAESAVLPLAVREEAARQKRRSSPTTGGESPRPMRKKRVHPRPRATTTTNCPTQIRREILPNFMPVWLHFHFNVPKRPYVALDSP